MTPKQEVDLQKMRQWFPATVQKGGRVRRELREWVIRDCNGKVGTTLAVSRIDLPFGSTQQFLMLDHV